MKPDGYENQNKGTPRSGSQAPSSVANVGGAPTLTDAPTSRPPSPADVERLLKGQHADPHAILGAHPARESDEVGVVVRAMMPHVTSIDCVLDDGRLVP